MRNARETATDALKGDDCTDCNSRQPQTTIGANQCTNALSLPNLAICAILKKKALSKHGTCLYLQNRENEIFSVLPLGVSFRTTASYFWPKRGVRGLLSGQRE